jgi:hypothetical protein
MYIHTAINRIDPVKKAISENRLRFNRNGSYSYTPSREYELKYGKIAKEKHLEKVTLRDATIVCARRLGRIANALDSGRKVVRIKGGLMMGS